MTFRKKKYYTDALELGKSVRFFASAVIIRTPVPVMQTVFEQERKKKERSIANEWKKKRDVKVMQKKKINGGEV